MTHRILLVEDDQRLAQLVKDYLEINQDFQVTIEINGGKVARVLDDVKPDLLILDLGLPLKDGMTICREVRADFKGPILMLTARNDDADQILGLECGADDYVIKPVEPSLLLARIKALLRRYSVDDKNEKNELNFGCLNIQLSARRVSLNNVLVDVSSHEFDLLLLFAKMPNQTISREFLFHALYSRPYDGLDRTMDVRISQLRKKLGDRPDKPFRIKTVWGRGYMFVGDAW